MIDVIIQGILLLIIFIFLWLERTTKIKQLTKKYQDEIQAIKDNTITTETKSLNGIFEIHITVDPQNNFVRLLEFVKYYEKTKSLKIVYAVSSITNNQYMISHFTRKSDEKEAIDNALHIAKDMCSFNIKVNRVKVESHGAEGTPVTKKDYQLFFKWLKNKYKNEPIGTPYFEFHVKVSANRKEEQYFSLLERDVKNFKFTAISYNLCSQNRHPLLTIRVYGEGFSEAEKYKDFVINQLKNRGYVFEDQIQQEFSIYDSNSKMDEGWLVYQ